MAEVLFRLGSKAQYDALAVKDSNTLYWLEDAQLMYKGDVLYAVGAEATQIASGLMSASDKKKIDSIPLGHTFPEKVGNYLYEISYDTYEYADGYEYMERYHYIPSCSAVRKDNFIGRNLDWYYDNCPNFLIRTKAVNKRHSTIGVAFAGGYLTDDIASSGIEHKYYKYLPFSMSDVINDCGVYCNMNVVPAGDKGYTTGTHPDKQGLCQLMLPRYVCDYASSAKEALALLDNMNVYAPLNVIGQECHFLLCDSINSYVIEFINNEMVVYSNTDEDYFPIPNDEAIITNFYLSGWNGECKTVYGGYSEEEVRATGLTDHSQGIERYTHIHNAYNDIHTLTDMDELMKSLKYTLTYHRDTDPFWYSEFTGDYTKEGFGNLTIYSQKSDFNDIVNHSIEEYEKHERGDKIWISKHTCIYDIDNKKIIVYSEEDFNHRYEFKLHIPGTIESLEWGEF